MRPLHHAVVLFSMVVGLFTLYGPLLWNPGPRVDEEIYEAAISLAESGASPYEEGGFFYPPTFARAGVALRSVLGLEATRMTLRAINVVGLAFLLWFTIILGVRGARTANVRDRAGADSAPSTNVAEPPLGLLAALPFALLLLPGVRLGLSTGNFSFLVGALAVAAIWHVDRRPVAAGLLLGATLLIKPLVAGALPLMLLPRSIPRGSRWPERISRARVLGAAVATGFASLLLWFDRHQLGAMFATELDGVPRGRSLSIYRFARELGLGELRLPLFGVAILVLGLALWGRLDDPRDLLVGSTLAVPMTTLVVWSHTLIMCLPLAALAIARLLARRRAEQVVGLGREPRHRIELVLVCGASALLAFTSPGGFGDQPGFVQALLLAPFLAAPVALAAYWFRTAPDLDGT